MVSMTGQETAGQETAGPLLEFLGAVGTVTGSRFLVRSDRSTVLIDAGMFQGNKADRLSNWEPFPVDPRSIDAVLLTHAHIDHSGWLPRLVSGGFGGPVRATPQTRDLCRILLPDSAHIHQEQARFANERGFSKHKPALPLYTAEDVDDTLPLIVPVEFGVATEVADGITATFTPAGHILGSASIHLAISDGAVTRSLLVSGDLGRGGHPLVAGPTIPPSADTLLVESTYGDSVHGNSDDELEQLAALIRRTAARGGTVLVPAFAVDRTEVFLTVLRDLMAAERIPTLRVYVDSPMALRVLDVYRSALRDADPMVVVEGATDAFDPGGGLVECPSVEESKSLNELTAPSIIVSASGMATGGRVLHHLARLLPDPRNAIVLGGFQAAGTRGRSLADGATSIKMFGRYFQVRAEVMKTNSFSVHADSNELVRWVARLPEPPATVFVVHGEPDASNALATRLIDELQLNAVVPKRFERVVLD